MPTGTQYSRSNEQQQMDAAPAASSSLAVSDATSDGCGIAWWKGGNLSVPSRFCGAATFWVSGHP